MRTVEGVITGLALSERLSELKETISQNLGGASRAWGDWMEHVRCVGEALQEAYERLGRRRKWSRWVRANLTISLRSTRDYRRIYRKWDSPELTEARRNGGKLQSIHQVLQILRTKRKSPAADKSPQHVLAEERRARLRELVAEELREMTLEELQVFSESFHDGDLWYRVRAVVAQAVVSKFGDDYYKRGDTPLNPWIIEKTRKEYEQRFCDKIRRDMRRDGYPV